MDRFVEGFRDALVSRLRWFRREIMAASSRQLCQLYEGLTNSQRHRFWSDVAAHMGDRTNRETSKHYHNAFKHHLYSEELTDQDKEWIRRLLQKGRAAGLSKNALIAMVVEGFQRANRDVFLQKIKSFVYQELKRITEQEGQRSAPETDRDSGNSSVDSRESSGNNYSFGPEDSFGLYDDVQSPLEEWGQDESSPL